MGNEKRKLSAILEQMRADLEDQMDFIDMIAKLRRHKYEALLREGFAKGEALELCKGSVTE